MTGRRLAWVAAAVLVAALGERAGAAASPVVRVGYIVPADREPQTGYQHRIDSLLRHIQGFYADAMERQGFGRRTFRLEDAGGRVRVHLVRAGVPAKEMAAGGHAKYAANPYWDNVVGAAREAGLGVWSDGEIWLLFVEAHVQDPDGTIRYATAQSSGTHSSGVAIVSADKLALGSPALLADTRLYGGALIPGLGPNRLEQGISYLWYNGRQIGSLAAAEIGAVAHELGHCFGMQHQYLNDGNFNGTLMGNGFRGWRGYALPDRFPNEDVRLARANACILSLSPYIRDEPLAADEPTPEIVAAGPEGVVTLVDGRVEVRYDVADRGGHGIALVTLENGLGRDGVGIVSHDEWPARPGHAKGTLRTSVFDVDRDDTWRLRAFDGKGNMAERILRIRVRSGANVAPRPFIRTRRDVVEPGVEIAFDGSRTVDPEGQPMRYVWSFGDARNGVGVRASHCYAREGTYEVRLSATDTAGATGTVSLWVRVRAAP